MRQNMLFTLDKWLPSITEPFVAIWRNKTMSFSNFVAVSNDNRTEMHNDITNIGFQLKLYYIIQLYEPYCICSFSLNAHTLAYANIAHNMSVNRHTIPSFKGMELIENAKCTLKVARHFFPLRFSLSISESCCFFFCPHNFNWIFCIYSICLSIEECATCYITFQRTVIWEFCRLVVTSVCLLLLLLLLRIMIPIQSCFRASKVLMH